MIVYMNEVLKSLNLLDDPGANGKLVKNELENVSVNQVDITQLKGEQGETDFLKITIPGKRGKQNGGNAPTLGILGRLGGVGARPGVTGMVSDADGAIVAVACALGIGKAWEKGDVLDGDVVITTHIAPDAPTKPHEPTPFMDSPVAIEKVLRYEVDEEMDALLSVDTTKGNRVIKVPGFAITPTVKDGWILKVADDLIDTYERVMGNTVAVVPITMQDITPYGNHVYHINSIMQPWTKTDSPLVGVATTAQVPVSGCGTGANYVQGLEPATRFCIEVAKQYTAGDVQFYDREEYEILAQRYGDMGSRLREG